MSDSSTGQILGGVAGATIGFFAGGPVGAVQGFSIGYGIGGAIDPPPGPLIRAPRLDDLTFQSSTYGAGLPSIYGTVGLSGNVIYLENGKYKEVVSREEQGKGGGGPTVETVEYFATFAVSISEEIAGAAIKRMWLGGKLFYNAGSDDLGTIVQSNKNAEGFRFYDGTQTEPDDRIESVVGTANAESYRGTAYIILYDLPLAEYGNGLQGAPVKVEVVTGQQSQVTLIDSFSTPADANNTLARVLPQSFGETDAYMGTYNRDDVNVGLVDITYQSHDSNNWNRSNSGTSNVIWTAPRGLNDGLQQYASAADALGISYADAAGKANLGYQMRGNSNLTSGPWASIGSSTISFGADQEIASPEGVMSGVGVSYDKQYAYFVGTNNFYKYDDSMGLVYSFPHGLPIFNNYEISTWDDDGTIWVGVKDSSTSSVNDFYIVDEAGQSFDLQFSLPNTQYGTQVGLSVSEFSVIGNVLYRSYLDAHPSGNIVYEQWKISTVDSYAEPLVDVFDSIVSKAGIDSSQTITADLNADEVKGYIVTIGDARGALSQLQAAFLFDVIQNGYKLEAVKRGKAPVVTIPYRDLGAKGAGSDAGDRLTTRREMDTQLPSRLEVQYLDPDREYDTASQYADYPTTSENERSNELAIVMSPDQAAGIADILINAAWNERTGFTFSLPQPYLYLRVSDVVTIETPIRDYIVRLESRSEEIDQTIKWTGKLQQQDLYQSSAKGGEGTIPDETIPLLSDSMADILDIPMISNDLDSAGVGAVMRGKINWAGGSLFKSVDNGATYTNVQSFVRTPPRGTAINALASSEGFVIERETELTLNVSDGSFSSVTQEQLMAGANWCAYGADGRWEIIRYQTASVNADDTVTLSNFIRGHRGTEWATGLHQAGDLVINLSDTGTQYFGADLERLGVEGLFKPVTIGSSVVDANPQPFTYRGINLKPLSPVLGYGNFIGSDWSIGFISRTRYQGSFWVSGVQPENEPVLSYELDIVDGAEVKRTLRSSLTEFDYTEAQQIEDFGSIQSSVDVVGRQISQRVGGGAELSFSVASNPILDKNNPDLIAMYTYGSISGQTVNDSSPNGNNGTVVGAVNQVTGIIGQALDFDGSTNYVNTNSLASYISTGSFAASLWFKSTTTAPDWSAMFGGHTSTGANSFLVELRGDKGGWVELSGGTRISSEVNYLDGGWHHVAVSFDGVGKSLYVDGGFIGYVPSQDSDIPSTTLSLIGMDWDSGLVPSNFFTGAQDQFRFFDRPLTQAEVSALYEEGSP